jgi:uncharacterized Tic20 family protein
MNVADEIQKLQQLRQTGAITEEEFAVAKARLINAPPAGSDFAEAPAPSAANVEHETRLWGMILHLSVLAGHLIPYAGLVAPIVIWQLKKNELPGVDVHGKNAVNWIISFVIYSAVCFVLFFVLIGIPMLAVLGVLGIVFPVVAAIKANNGEYWKYPLAIPFFK